MLGRLIESSLTTEFTTALVKNASEDEVFGRLRGDGFGEIRVVRVMSKQNLSWQVRLLNEDGEVIRFENFLSTSSCMREIDGVIWYFYVSTVYWMIPKGPQFKNVITVSLLNLSDDAKLAGTNGQVKVSLECTR